MKKKLLTAFLAFGILFTFSSAASASNCGGLPNPPPHPVQCPI